MPKVHKPRSGSLQFWPRKRARRIYPRIRSWDIQEVPSGFAGYKAGMTHIQYKGKDGTISTPVTVLECPPLKVFTIRFYKNNNPITEIHSKNINKELTKKLKIPKKIKETIPENYDKITLLAYTQPKLTNIKKKPEIFEIPIKSLEKAKDLLAKEIQLKDIFKPGQVIDVHSVTTGKGFQGPVKRFGISLKSHKSEKKRRSAGNLGAWTPKKVSFTVPQAGQMGFHTRTEYNKQILAILTPEEINQKAGFKRYGVLKNPALLIKGSIPGPKKRLIRLSYPIRKTKPIEAPQITFIKK